MVLNYTETHELHLTAMFGDLRNPRNNENARSIQLSSAELRANLSANSFSIACICLKRTYGFWDSSKEILIHHGGFCGPDITVSLE
jgi:hypothetical protein